MFCHLLLMLKMILMSGKQINENIKFKLESKILKTYLKIYET